MSSKIQSLPEGISALISFHLDPRISEGLEIQNS